MRSSRLSRACARTSRPGGCPAGRPVAARRGVFVPELAGRRRRAPARRRPGTLGVGIPLAPARRRGAVGPCPGARRAAAADGAGSPGGARPHGGAAPRGRRAPHARRRASGREAPGERGPTGAAARAAPRRLRRAQRGAASRRPRARRRGAQLSRRAARTAARPHERADELRPRHVGPEEVADATRIPAPVSLVVSGSLTSPAAEARPAERRGAAEAPKPRAARRR